ncbi:hypothetical protein M405DRAFT_832304 [Rhizopogon salebrosus TDB-379]|nr:hypothetical protein M405DRAFT_832304 [Rhizopogon salebrosus TDB-379]
MPGIQVQQFADLDNDAKDEPAFVGNHWLDLFPRAIKCSRVAVSTISQPMSYHWADVTTF